MDRQDPCGQPHEVGGHARHTTLRNAYFPESRFGGFTRFDGTVAFFARVRSLVSESSVVLDVGCGRGKAREDPVLFRRSLRVMRGSADRVIGIDVDEAASVNPTIDEFRLITDRAWPVEADSVDLCLGDFVVEHLEEPDSFFGEARRVLRPGGHLCIRTSNSWSYVALLARLIPNRAHAVVLARAQRHRRDEDIFDTVYRCNSVPRLRSSLRRHGFDAVVYGHPSEPLYLAASPLAYRVGVIYQRLAPGWLQPALFAFARLHEPAARR